MFADYNGDGNRQEGEAMVDVRSDGTYTLPVDTRKLTMGDDRVSVAINYPRYGNSNDDYTIRCLAPAQGCWQVVRVQPEQTTANVDFPRAGRRPAQRNDLGRQERERRPRGGRGRRPVPARVPRRRPRRRARSQRAVVALDQHHRQVHLPDPDALPGRGRGVAAARASSARRAWTARRRPRARWTGCARRPGRS